MSLCPHGVRIEHRNCDRCEEIALAENAAARRAAPLRPWIDVGLPGVTLAEHVELLKEAQVAYEAMLVAEAAFREAFEKLMSSR